MTADDWIAYRAEDQSTWPPDNVFVLCHFFNGGGSIITDVIRMCNGNWVLSMPSFIQITHWQPIVPPVKKRWQPKFDEVYWTPFATSEGFIPRGYHFYSRDQDRVASGSACRTEAECQIVCDALNACVTEIAGVV